MALMGRRGGHGTSTIGTISGESDGVDGDENDEVQRREDSDGYRKDGGGK